MALLYGDPTPSYEGGEAAVHAPREQSNCLWRHSLSACTCITQGEIKCVRPTSMLTCCERRDLRSETTEARLIAAAHAAFSSWVTYLPFQITTSRQNPHDTSPHWLPEDGNGF